MALFVCIHTIDAQIVYFLAIRKVVNYRRIDDVISMATCRYLMAARPAFSMAFKPNRTLTLTQTQTLTGTLTLNLTLNPNPNFKNLTPKSLN